MAIHGGHGPQALSATALPRVLIGARTVIDGAPLVMEPVYYPTLVGAYARALRGRARLVVEVDTAQAEALRSALDAEGCLADVDIVDALPEPEAGDLHFGLGDIYIPSALRAGLRSGVLEPPVWVVRERPDIARAAATLERQDMYVLARYLVIPTARRVARALLPTSVSPNTVTAWSCICGVAAAFAPFFGSGFWGRGAAALLVHVSITLDFSDGYLARLRGTDSRTGYWFDTMMDEVVKFSLFVSLAGLVLIRGIDWAIACAAAVLVLYHVLTCNHWLSKSLEQTDVTASAVAPAPRWRPGLVGLAQRAYERINYLDVHLYLVAAALLTATEAWLLALFAAIYLFRFMRMLQVRLAAPAQ